MEKFYTYQQVADLVGVGVITIKRAAWAGTLKTTKFGHKTIRVSETDLQIFINSKKNI